MIEKRGRNERFCGAQYGVGKFGLQGWKRVRCVGILLVQTGRERGGGVGVLKVCPLVVKGLEKLLRGLLALQGWVVEERDPKS